MAVVTSELDGLDASHRVATLIQVLIDGEVQGELLDSGDEVVTEGEVTYDSSAAFRSRLDMTVVSEALAPIAPISELAPYGTELRIHRGLYVGSATQMVRLGVFKIERASTDGGVTTIGANDRAMIVSEAKFEQPLNIAALTDAGEAIQTIIEGAYPSVVFDFVTTDIPLPALLCDEGDDPWVAAQGIARSIGCEVYFNDDGVCVLEIVPTSLAANSVATFDEGTVLLGAQRDWDRADVYNKVIVTGENSNNDDVYRGEAEDDNPNSPTWYNGSFGRKPYRWSSEYISSDDQALTAASAILSRTIGAPDNLSFEALVDPSRRPWDVVEINREKLGLSEAHVLDTVSIPLSYSGSMSGTTRATLEVDLG